MTDQEVDPVGEALRGLSQVLKDSPTGQWSPGQCSAVLEALEDAVRPHQLDDGWARLCSLDGQPWPCLTYRQVQDTLEGLL